MAKKDSLFRDIRVSMWFSECGAYCYDIDMTVSDLIFNPVCLLELKHFNESNINMMSGQCQSQYNLLSDKKKPIPYFVVQYIPDSGFKSIHKNDFRKHWEFNVIPRNEEALKLISDRQFGEHMSAYEFNVFILKLSGQNILPKDKITKNKQYFTSFNYVSNWDKW